MYYHIEKVLEGHKNRSLIFVLTGMAYLLESAEAMSIIAKHQKDMVVLLLSILGIII